MDDLPGAILLLIITGLLAFIAIIIYTNLPSLSAKETELLRDNIRALSYAVGGGLLSVIIGYLALVRGGR